jgi:tetratricopeptide (TPR) repeat protein
VDLGYASQFEGSGNYSAASSSYASAAARLPWNRSLWEQAAEMAQLGNDPENAFIFLKKAAELNALSPQGWVSLGKKYQLSGEISEAMAAWGHAFPLTEAYALLAGSHQQAAEFQDAKQDWLAAIKQDPQNAILHYRLGLLFMATAPEDALFELMQAAQLDPSLDPTVQALRIALNKAFITEDRGSWSMVSGQALGALGEWDLAAEAFRQAIIQHAGDADAWVWLGEAEQMKGQDGWPAIEKALALDPGSATVQGLYGMYLLRQGESDAGLAVFQKAALLAPEDPAWQIGLGSASVVTGDLVAAYGYFSKAVELEPENASTWRALVSFCVNNDVKLIEIGLPGAHKLVELAPEDWTSYDLSGQAEFLLEDYQAAEIDLKKAVQLSPTQAAPALHLGLVFMETGDRISAYSYLNLALTFDPAGDYGWQAKRLLEQYFP